MEFLEKRAKELGLSSRSELIRWYIVSDMEGSIDAKHEDEKKKEHIFEVVLEQEADGRYYIHCPALKGCRTWGHTEAETLHYMQEALELYIEDLIADGKPIPDCYMV